MRQICIILLLCLLPLQTFAASGKVLQIEKNNLVFLNLWKKPEVKKLYESWDLTFRVLEWKKLQFTYKRWRIYLHIPWVNVSEEWIIEITLGEQSKQIPYRVNYIKDDWWMDLQHDFLFKRIQQKPLSCESSAASDIITFLQWKVVHEEEVYSLLDKDKAWEVAIKSGNKYIWWNPNKWFVWHVDYYWENNIKPTQRLLTWYGVYEKPIEKVYQTYGLKTKIINNSDYHKYFNNKEHMSLLLKFLNKGKMVQLWGDRCTDPVYEDSLTWSTTANSCPTLNENRKIEWYYKEWEVLKKHIWLRGEHSFYLLGYEWNLYNPDKIIVWDTDTWYHKYVTKEWMRKWDLMDNRSIVVGN